MPDAVILHISCDLRDIDGNLAVTVSIRFRYPDGDEEEWEPTEAFGALQLVDEPVAFLNSTVVAELAETRRVLKELGFGVAFPPGGPAFAWTTHDEPSRAFLAALEDDGRDAWKRLASRPEPPEIPDVPDPLAAETAAVSARMLERLEAATARLPGFAFEPSMGLGEPANRGGSILDADGNLRASVFWHGSGITFDLDADRSIGVYAYQRDLDDVTREVDQILDDLWSTR